jgi:hypothetical protein
MTGAPHPGCAGSHHFLSRLCKLQQLATHRCLISIHKMCCEDLLIMLHFLEIAKKGININLIAFHQPTHIYWSDACPFGLSGYLNEGFAWCFKILEDLLLRLSNSLIEYMVSIILPWVDMLKGRLKRDDCAFLMTDSSTSVGWLRKTIIGKDADLIQEKIQIKTACHQATLFLKVGINSLSAMGGHDHPLKN